jgi:hypothetical protein
MTYLTRAAQPTDVQPAGHFRTSWEHRLDGDTSIEEIARAPYWVHASAHLRMFDTIAVMPQNGAYYAELLVTNVITTSTGVKIPSLKVLMHIELKEVAAPAPEPEVGEVHATDTYSVEWKGPAHRFCIIRKSDRALVEKGIAKKEDALARVPILEAA